MTSFDPDLIAALAEGTLPPDRAAALEQEISADPHALAELEAQRTALRAMKAEAPVVMTDSERIRLRSSVAEALGVDRSPTPEPAVPGRRRIHWPAIAVAAASLVAIVAIVPGVLTTGDDAENAATLVLAEDSTESTAARDAAGAQSNLADTTPSPSSGVFDEAGDSADSSESPEVLAVPPADQATPPPAGGEEALEAATTTVAAAATTAAPTTTAVPMVARAIDPILQLIRDGLLLADDAVTDCGGFAAGRLGEGAAAARVPFEGSEAIVWFVPGEEDPTALMLFSPGDCTLLAEFP
jgi:hypothetical protein